MLPSEVPAQISDTTSLPKSGPGVKGMEHGSRACELVSHDKNFFNKVSWENTVTFQEAFFRPLAPAPVRRTLEMYFGRCCPALITCHKLDRMTEQGFGVVG